MTDAAWLDWVVIYRAVHGIPIGRPLTSAEVRHLYTVAGWPVEQIFPISGQHVRDVRRWCRGEVMPCGTIAAYRRHLRNREPACSKCLDAQAESSARRRAAA